MSEVEQLKVNAPVVGSKEMTEGNTNKYAISALHNHLGSLTRGPGLPSHPSEVGTISVASCQDSQVVSS